MLTVQIPNETDLRLSYVPQEAFDYVRSLALETVTDVQGQIKIINSQIQVLNDLESSQETQMSLLRVGYENGFVPHIFGFLIWNQKKKCNAIACS
jgi:hypothetical protein